MPFIFLLKTTLTGDWARQLVLILIEQRLRKEETKRGRKRGHDWVWITEAELGFVASAIVNSLIIAYLVSTLRLGYSLHSEVVLIRADELI